MDIHFIHLLHKHGLLHDIDISFAYLMSKLSGDNSSEELFIAAILLSNRLVDEKHICLDLKTKAEEPLIKIFPDIPQDEQNKIADIKLPSLSKWIKQLKKSPVVGEPFEFKPLILFNNRLYLYRYFSYERELADSIKKKLQIENNFLDNILLKEGFRNYFKESPTLPDWQKLGAFAALKSNFCVISGGPGTGKTFTVTNIITLLLEQNPNQNIKLCAPTGKASARLQESIRDAKEYLKCSNDIKNRIPDDTSTIHRLLGYKPNSPYFRYNRRNLLPVDIVIVDEASMVSLPLMSKLIEAIPVDAKLILLGDKDQLASVEAGSVLGDICGAAEINRFTRSFCEAYYSVANEKIPDYLQINKSPILKNCIVELQYSYRFDANQGIGAASKAVNKGDAELSLSHIKDKSSKTIKHRNLPHKNEVEYFVKFIVELRYQGIFKAKTLKEAYSRFTEFRILCAYREGIYGVEGINELIEKILYEKRLVGIKKNFYIGKPLMISQNDYNLRLFNGDIGIIWLSDDRELRAFFPNQDGTFRSFALARLPKHETAFAMTVHKSQGSEFENILIILSDKDSPIITRELLYTGMTRAKSGMEIWMKEDIYKSAVKRRIERASGLVDLLKDLKSVKKL
ncbi:MAG: exodeoxyribonuclease V subunit alpha [Desulfobacterales bacterium]|nr:exodeoxyribonuclease V subunit alpha [Desulfobacterales bacterium]